MAEKSAQTKAKKSVKRVSDGIEGMILVSRPTRVMIRTRANDANVRWSQVFKDNDQRTRRCGCVGSRRRQPGPSEATTTLQVGGFPVRMGDFSRKDPQLW